MGWGGHALDMIVRNKQNRESLRIARGSARDANKRYKSRVPDISFEEFEAISRQTREKKERDAHHLQRMSIIVTAILVATALLVMGAVYFFFL